jgi:hypothetical protein
LEKEKSVEDMVTLGQKAQATLVKMIEALDKFCILLGMSEINFFDFIIKT